MITHKVWYEVRLEIGMTPTIFKTYTEARQEVLRLKAGCPNKTMSETNREYWREQGQHAEIYFCTETSQKI